MMDSEGRASTASTVSGIYRNILQSPAPICMFYFSHPFGIATPIQQLQSQENASANNNFNKSSSNESSSDGKKMTTKSKYYKRQEKYDDKNVLSDDRISSYVPWPKDTWRRDYALPPIVQLLASQMGHSNVTDLETIIRNIRHAWNTPNNRSHLHSRARDIHNYTPHTTSSSSATSQHNNNYNNMVSGTYCSLAGPGLLKRRYSVPEIIMRKHTLAQQKSYEDNTAKLSKTTVPTPCASPAILPNQYRPQRSSTSCITRVSSTGSDSNLSFTPYNVTATTTSNTNDTSMRRQLLRRIWSKECRQYDTRSGSWSPPMRRSQRRLYVEVPPDKCMECSKIEQKCALIASPKRVRLNSSPITLSNNHYQPNSNNQPPIKSSTTISTNSPPPHRDISSSEVPIGTISTSDTITTESSLSNNHKNENVINKNDYNYLTSRDTSSVDGDDDVSVSDSPNKGKIDTDKLHDITKNDINNTTAINCKATIATHISTNTTTTPTTTATTNNNNITDIADSGKFEHDSTSNDDIALESINQSRTDENENRNNLSLCNLSSGHTEMSSGDTIEENGNEISLRTTADGQYKNNESTTGNELGVDQYISNVLIDGLNNMINSAMVVNERQGGSNNNLIDNYNVNLEDTHPFLDYNENKSRILPSEKLNQINDKKESIKYSASSTVPISAIIKSTINKLDLENDNEEPEERTIYFPQYSAESTADASIYSTQLSEDDFLDDRNYEKNSPNIISVQSGSTYPNLNYAEPFIIPRLTHRTESMEAEPSSASPRRNDDNGGNDSDVSLVDSLDDPIGSPHLIKQHEIMSPKPSVPATKTPIEKSKSFFVAIVDDANNQPHVDKNLDVATAMPTKLREKLIKRQQNLDTKKHQEQTKKQKKLQKIINRNRKTDVVTTTDTTTKPKPTKTDLQNNFLKPKTKNKFLRSEIGMLESYTIDGRGNMQFKQQPPQKEKSSSSSTQTTAVTTGGRRSVQPVQKKLSTQSLNNRSKGDIITIKRSQTKKSTFDSNQRRKEIIKDVQHMTLYQADLITPDTECGPRRMYQKTEIHDGEKRIEILEIVECVDSCCSSPDDDNSATLQEEIDYHYNSAINRKSKIPIPVFKSGQPTNFQKFAKNTSRESSPGKIFVKNIQHLGNNSKVDQMIADLLIEALNHPKELGIEFIKSPKESSRNGSAGKRPVLSRRNGSGAARRSAGGSGGSKYQHIFEVIPEEKGSFSVESTDESVAASVSNRIKEKLQTKDSIPNTGDATLPKIPANIPPRCGKEAINSDITATDSDAWVGFFKQHDETSGVDSGNEADLIKYERHQRNNVENNILTKQQKTVTVIEKPTKTICTFSSPNTSSVLTTTITPTISASADLFVSSSGSENILSVIEKTLDNSFDSQSNISTNSQYLPANCTQCKIIEKELKERETIKVEEIVETVGVVENVVVKAEASDTSLESPTIITENKPNESVWQVSDIKSHVRTTLSPIESVQESSSKSETSSQLSDFKTLTKTVLSPIESAQESSTKSEIDSTSFIILKDDVGVPKQAKVSTKEPQTHNGTAEQSTKSSPNVKTHETLPAIKTGSPKDRCNDCCYCNPDLHKRDGFESAKSCNFCFRKSTLPKTNESKSTNTTNNVYESLTKSDHTHIRTKSKESDTVSLKCTRTNSKIRRFIPETEETTKNNTNNNDDDNKPNRNIQRTNKFSKKPPKGPATIPTSKRTRSEPKKPLITDRNQTPKDTTNKPILRLPSPFTTGVSSQSYDSTTSSQCSSSSSSPCSPKCTILPTTPSNRWHSNGQRHSNKLERTSRYQDFYGRNNNNDINMNNNNNSRIVSERVTNNNEINTTVKQSSGWSLTLAGTYRDDMAPDVEMKLSFPKKSPQIGESCMAPMVGENVTDHNYHDQKRKVTPKTNKFSNGHFIYKRDNSDISNENYQINRNMHPALPPTTMNSNINPKRTLSKALPDNNRNSRNCNLPDVNTFNRDVARQTARKTIKRSEYSVAVASATRTISNFTHGKRAMSFQALNANAYRIDNRDRRRDHSIDLGNISSRRMSYDECQTPSDGMALSVLGNAIAPEQKPRVPTMSERDLTRKQTSCFTRNRAFFS